MGIGAGHIELHETQARRPDSSAGSSICAVELPMIAELNCDPAPGWRSRSWVPVIDAINAEEAESPAVIRDRPAAERKQQQQRRPPACRCRPPDSAPTRSRRIRSGIGESIDVPFSELDQEASRPRPAKAASQGLGRRINSAMMSWLAGNRNAIRARV